MGDQAAVKKALASHDPDWVKRVGNEQYKKGCFSEALALYDRAIALDPNQAAFHGNRAAVLTSLNRIAEAVKECELAIQLDPNFARAHQRLGGLLTRFGKLDEAMWHLHKSEELGAERSDTGKVGTLQEHISKAGTATANQDWDEALRQAEMAIQAGADLTMDVWKIRVKALLQLRRLAEAEKVLQEAQQAESAALWPGAASSDSELLCLRAEIDIALGRLLLSSEEVSVQILAHGTIKQLDKLGLSDPMSRDNNEFHDGFEYHCTPPLSRSVGEGVLSSSESQDSQSSKLPSNIGDGFGATYGLRWGYPADHRGSRRSSERPGEGSAVWLPKGNNTGRSRNDEPAGPAGSTGRPVGHTEPLGVDELRHSEQVAGTGSLSGSAGSAEREGGFAVVGRGDQSAERSGPFEITGARGLTAGQSRGASQSEGRGRLPGSPLPTWKRESSGSAVVTVPEEAAGNGVAGPQKRWGEKGEMIDRKGPLTVLCGTRATEEKGKETLISMEWEMNKQHQADEIVVLESIYGEDFSVMRKDNDGGAQCFEVVIHVAVPEAFRLVTEFLGPPTLIPFALKELSIEETSSSKSAPLASTALDEVPARATPIDGNITGTERLIIPAADASGSSMVESSSSKAWQIEEEERNGAGSCCTRSCRAEASSSKAYGPSFPLEYLPPLRLFCTLSESYPSRSAPSFTLACSWLDDVQLSHLCKELDAIWNATVGEVTVYQWVSWIERESLSFLGLTNAIVLRPHEDDVPKLEKDERANAEGGTLEQKVLKLLKYNEERKLDAFRRGMHLCAICYEEQPGTAFLRLPCAHFYCRACMRQYTAGLVNEGTVTRLHCPGCKEPMPYPIVKELLDEKHFRRWEDILLRRTLDAMEDLVYCPRCDVACLESSDHLAQCQKCFFSFCGLCRGSWHAGSDCLTPEIRLAILQARTKGKQATEEQLMRYEALVNEQLNLKYLEDTMKCPACKMAIVKEEGCNKMTCTNCGSYFCYRCGKKIDGYEHFERGCVLFDSPELEAWDRDARRGRAIANALWAQQGAIGEAHIDPMQVRNCPNCDAIRPRKLAVHSGGRARKEKVRKGRREKRKSRLLTFHAEKPIYFNAAGVESAQVVSGTYEGERGGRFKCTRVGEGSGVEHGEN
ncbi:hypothetical protein CBR_g37671 [Chara braunii]|uniref:RBR-type E3 ubiquitin transferase n=1 Tax=Chara braunii TaxID=69332 RepID=A0A388JZT3_CHABU|nr:hypothetical protein CBR_g37671 [Chara braunii]|eukprot:GBG63314.1 hypothetical protein CBR_g37671 [Chara braunii]